MLLTSRDQFFIPNEPCPCISNGEATTRLHNMQLNTQNLTDCAVLFKDIVFPPYFFLPDFNHLPFKRKHGRLCPLMKYTSNRWCNKTVRLQDNLSITASSGYIVPGIYRIHVIRIGQWSHDVDIDPNI